MLIFCPVWHSMLLLCFKNLCLTNPDFDSLHTCKMKQNYHWANIKKKRKKGTYINLSYYTKCIFNVCI